MSTPLIEAARELARRADRLAVAVAEIERAGGRAAAVQRPVIRSIAHRRQDRM